MNNLGSAVISNKIYYYIKYELVVCPVAYNRKLDGALLLTRHRLQTHTAPALGDHPEVNKSHTVI